ncbi:double-strand break repair helicase AddA [Sphingomonas canadensis]|uniref:DNA 3'-5' helicase n=1 Tax=Sphingomonas canadensis TaxID=1219257 RepID=A0ABW3HBK0_9SPHN|nr:double-strand break repair helicase AddA [Sphingomonas canadensis]MCW3837868.1 double-strand break repair helicase AddA [Sphingomonas canadensis]
MTGPAVLHPLQGNQRDASDPLRNIWLAASAGTGKTQVLAARVWRLLLRGVDPGAILCLTFTKAGAAEMAGRIAARLAHWVRADRIDLQRDLDALGERGGPEQIALARTLFAKVLDAPGGGLRIQTIHSFCQGLLAAFPVEAGLIPGFRPLDEREEAGLRREALAEMLVAAEREGRGSLIDAIGALSLRMGEGGAEGFLAACAHAADALEALPAGIQPFVRRALGLPSGDIEAALAEACADDAFDIAGLRRIAAANAARGAKTGLERADLIASWIAAGPAARVAWLGDLLLAFRTRDGKPRSVSAKLTDAEPAYEVLAEALGDACAALIAMRSGAAYADLLARGLEAGRDYARAYADAKRRAGAVDFDDLIRATVRLLATPGMGDWVRYKLDQATEHVLIDEAQDTNWDQWRIVRAVADEFFAGETTRAEGVRTLFTVGDYKQAIFGFQGTDPYYFALAHRHFERLAEAALARDRYDAFDDPRRAAPLDTLSLTHSYRSTRPVLEFVDNAIGALPPDALGAFSAIEPHGSRVAGPGSVALWPPIAAGQGDPEGDEEEWVDDATRALARRIARQVKAWVGTLELGSKGRTLEPGDVMILVKRRGELASLIVARLYAEGVPVAGVDRLRLNAPLAVQDLLAAIRFALQPEDDLSLASLLVSPLIGWSQDELMAAALRERGSLWAHLSVTQSEERLAPLRALLARADFTTPYRFLEEILSGPMQGRRRLLHRLGEEARDPIDELLGAALSFESVATPSLQRFLDWFDRDEFWLKRESGEPRGAVRVMTAHGSKGLQAPLVILADATIDPANNRRDLFGWRPEGHEGDPIPIFRPRAEERLPPLAEVLAATDARELQEHWRLFYVAATRAEERLVIAGALGPRAKGVAPPDSWHALAARAFDALGVTGEGERVFTGTAPEPPVPARAAARAGAAPPPSAPGWLLLPAPEESRPPRPLAPSSLGEDLVTDPPPGPAMRAAAERGRLLHALFERLPAVPAERRADAADRWLAGAGGVADPAARAALVRDALRVTEDAAFAELFGPGSIAEAPIAAVVGGAVVAGTVDRLVVTPERVRVIDFKTARRAPADVESVPPWHLRQIAAYVAALEVVFPGRTVEAALLYTAGPVLHALPPVLIERHKPRLDATEQSLAPRA